MTTTFSRFSALLIIVSACFGLAPVPAAAAETPQLSFRIASVTTRPVPPTCEARSTKRRMASGNVTEIVWKSENASYMLGIIPGEPRPANGRQRIALSGPATYEFPLVFVGKGGLVTCYATVHVRAPRNSAR